MAIYTDFMIRLNRSYERAQQTAQGATLNKVAWREQAKDLAVMKKLLEEGTLFVAETERRAVVGLENAQTLETLSIQQAEDVSAAKMIGDNTGIFEAKDVGTVREWLAAVDRVVLAEAMRRLPARRRAELVEELSKLKDDLTEESNLKLDLLAEKLDNLGYDIEEKK